MNYLIWTAKADLWSPLECDSKLDYICKTVEQTFAYSELVVPSFIPKWQCSRRAQTIEPNVLVYQFSFALLVIVHLFYETILEYAFLKRFDWRWIAARLLMAVATTDMVIFHEVRSVEMGIVQVICLAVAWSLPLHFELREKYCRRKPSASVGITSGPNGAAG